MMKQDLVPLAQGLVLKQEDTGNGNILVVGTTGSGKTTSISEPRILETFHQSLVIPVVKRSLIDQYAPLLTSRGYEVIDINLASPEKSAYGFNPCEEVETDEDILSLANELTGNEKSRSMTGEMDPYWGEATISTVAAEIGLAVANARVQGKQPVFSDVLKVHSLADMDFTGAHAVSKLDGIFDTLAIEEPSLSAPKLWKTMSGNASKTASCIYSMVNNALDKLSGADAAGLFDENKYFPMSMIGQRKTALFITTSPVGAGSKKLSNLLYSCIFRCLFKEADRNGGKLKIPVHIIADDFACGSRIPEFSSYISVFREIGISCTLLLQSLSQLSAVYGPYEASVIEDNCDIRVYLGSSDLSTAADVSKRLDVSLTEVLEMPVNKVVVSRRGYPSGIYERYRTYEHQSYPCIR